MVSSQAARQRARLGYTTLFRLAYLAAFLAAWFVLMGVLSLVSQANWGAD